MPVLLWERFFSGFMSVAVHVVFVGLLVVSFEYTESPQPGSADVQPIEAVVLDEAVLEAELARLRDRETSEDRRQAERTKSAEERLALARKLTKLEEEKLATIQRLAEQRQSREDEAAKRVRAAEADRLERLKREQAAESERLSEVQRAKEATAAKKAALEKERQAAQASRDRLEQEKLALKKATQAIEAERAGQRRFDGFVSFTNRDPGVAQIASGLQQQFELLGATVFNTGAAWQRGQRMRRHHQ